MQYLAQFRTLELRILDSWKLAPGGTNQHPGPVADDRIVDGQRWECLSGRREAHGVGCIPVNFNVLDINRRGGQDVQAINHSPPSGLRTTRRIVTRQAVHYGWWRRSHP